tara:strand:- start:13526 stop:13690 length:165 start_codon:yes stop_codon:yes gene_type:complete
MVIYYTRPSDPATIPTDIKKPNSRRSLEPGGIEFKNNSKNLMPKEQALPAFDLS